jgi:hypothetical protein
MTRGSVNGMQPRGYHGGFQHPVRSFLIGTTLIVLLVAGFAAGVELGSPPAQLTKTRIVAGSDGRLQVVTELQPVVRTVVSDQTRIVRLPGIGRTRVIVVRENGKRVIAYIPQKAGETYNAKSAGEPVTVYIPEPASTVTVSADPIVSVSTVFSTVTVTAPPPTSDSSAPVS